MATTPLMNHLFSVSFILIILFLASQCYQCSSASELEKPPGSAVDKRGDNTVSGNSDLNDIDVVSKKTDKEKKKKKKHKHKHKNKDMHKQKEEKNEAHGLLQKWMSPFQVFSFVGYFVFFGFLLF